VEKYLLRRKERSAERGHIRERSRKGYAEIRIHVKRV